MLVFGHNLHRVAMAFWRISSKSLNGSKGPGLKPAVHSGILNFRQAPGLYTLHRL